MNTYAKMTVLQTNLVCLLLQRLDISKVHIEN